MNYSGRPPGNRVSPQLEAADVEVNRLRRLIAERDDALQRNLLLRDGFVAHGAADVVFGSTAPNSRQIPERETTVTKLSSNEGTDSVVHAVTSFSCSGGGSTAGMPSDCVEARACRISSIARLRWSQRKSNIHAATRPRLASLCGTVGEGPRRTA